MITAHAKLDLRPLERLNAAMESRLSAAVRNSAEWIVNDVKSHWSPESPSLRGNAPAKVTGTLERSARIYMRGNGGRFTSSVDAVQAEIRFLAPYSGVLETGKLDRPFLVPAVLRAEKVVGPMFFGGLFR